MLYRLHTGRAYEAIGRLATEMLPITYLARCFRPSEEVPPTYDRCGGFNLSERSEIFHQGRYGTAVAARAKKTEIKAI